MLNNLEFEVIKLFLDGDFADLKALRQQLDSVRNIDHEYTGTGVFLNFELVDEVPTTHKPNFILSDVSANIDGLMYPVGFILYVKDGKFTMLEGFGHEDKWI